MLKADKAITLTIGAMTVASLLITIGILWDVSWHLSVGRDEFLSPPHLVVYFAAGFGGLFSGFRVLKNTFTTSAETKKSFVKIWGVFYSSYGALFCIWGAIAMLTSAPFDDWWHNAFGLDIQILSPPHSLLLLGIFSLQFGVCIEISKHLNLRNPEDPLLPRLKLLFILAAASLVCMIYFFSSAFLRTRSMKLSLFYMAAAAITLLFLPAFNRMLRLKWGMFLVALGYFIIWLSMNLILQLFPATPKLGPILTHNTHFQPANFPILIIVPALLMDLIMQRKYNDLTKSALLSITFVALLVAIQYPFSGFLLESPGSRNWFFGSEAWYFGASPNASYRYKFSPSEIQPALAFAKGIGIALLIGLLASRLSLWLGTWMLRIQR